MNPRAVAGIILGVALARLTAIYISAGISSFFTEEVWLASFYYPAGAVDVIALLALGYWAAVGSGLASVIWNVSQFDLSAFEIAINLVAAVARGVVALWVFNVLVPRPRDTAWAAGHDVRLADVAGSGICTRPSAYRHVRNLAAKDVILLHGDGRLTITLAPRLARFEKAFQTAIRKLGP